MRIGISGHFIFIGLLGGVGGVLTGPLKFNQLIIFDHADGSPPSYML
jgi:hypothetical protein